MADVTEKNKAHFDERASTYDTRYSKTLSQLTTLLRDPVNLDFIGVNWIQDSSSSSSSDPSTTSSTPSLKLLDYACGTGLITRALLPHITRSIGIDISPSMVTQFNTHASNQGLSPTEMIAYEGNLLANPPDPRLQSSDSDELWDFDLAGVELAFHHFDDAELGARRLAERLKVGGVLVVVDFEEYDGLSGYEHGHAHGHGNHYDHHGNGNEKANGEKEKQISAQETVTHHGFSESGIKKIFEQAGLGKDFKYKILGKGIVFHGVHDANDKNDEEEGGEKKGKKDMRRTVFIARGVKT